MTEFYQTLKESKGNTTKKLMNYGYKKLVKIEVLLTPTNLLMLEEI